MGQLVKGTNGFTFVDEIGDRQAEIIRIITYYIGGFKKAYTARLPLERMDFPALVVQKARKIPIMRTNNIYEPDVYFSIFWYFTDDKIEIAEQKQREFGEALEKLFSNNALGDLDTNPSHKFIVNDPHWIDSNLTSVEYSPTLMADALKQSFCMAGRAELKVTAYLEKV